MLFKNLFKKHSAKLSKRREFEVDEAANEKK